MGRQRRAVMGSTNLPVLTHHCEARAGAHHLPGPRGTKQAATQDAKAPRRSTCDNDTMDQRPRAVKLKPTRHEKFKLPLISSSTGKTATHAGQCRTKRKLSPRDAQLAEHEQAKLVLGDSIDAHETASKSYKNEHWYTSPIGFGSKKSVLLAALKSRDPGGAGVITSKQLIQALQAPNFGLDEQQARSLLTEFDLQLLDEGAKVPYREFVRHLRLPDERPSQPGQDPTIFYQESYINRVRTHAAQLIEKVAAIDMESTRRTSTGTMRSSPRDALPPLTNNRPSREAPFTQEGDRLSFEFDKARKQRRAEAKSRILLVHINRIEAFSQHQQKVTEQHETMRLAAKALHRHAHFEQAFEEENRRLLIAQRLPKGMLGSPTAKMHHNRAGPAAGRRHPRAADPPRVPLPPGGHSAGAGLWRRLLLLLLGLRHARAVAHAPGRDARLLPAHGAGLAHARAVVRHALRRAVGAGGAPADHDGRRRLGPVPAGRGRGAAGLLPALQRLRAHRRLLGRHAAPALHARERAVAPAAALLLRAAGHRGHRGHGLRGVRGQAGGLVLAHGLRRRRHVSAVARLARGGARVLVQDEDRAAGVPRGEPDRHHRKDQGGQLGHVHLRVLPRLQLRLPHLLDHQPRTFPPGRSLPRVQVVVALCGVQAPRGDLRAVFPAVHAVGEELGRRRELQGRLRTHPGRKLPRRRRSQRHQRVRFVAQHTPKAPSLDY